MRRIQSCEFPNNNLNISNSFQGAVAAGGVLLTEEVIMDLLRSAKTSEYVLNSPGWYFGGENHLEVRGGIHFQGHKNGWEYKGSDLKIVDINDSSRHS